MKKLIIPLLFTMSFVLISYMPNTISGFLGAAMELPGQALNRAENVSGQALATGQAIGADAYDVATSPMSDEGMPLYDDAPSYYEGE